MNKLKIKEAIPYLKHALTDKQKEKINALRAADEEWYKPLHEGVGLSITIRNLLRLGGFREKDIDYDYEKEVNTPDGLKPCWIFILEQALK